MILDSADLSKLLRDGRFALDERRQQLVWEPPPSFRRWCNANGLTASPIVILADIRPPIPEQAPESNGA